MFMTHDEICELFKVDRSQLYHMMKDGFPQPIKISPRGNRWLVEEIRDWVAGKQEDR